MPMQWFSNIIAIRFNYYADDFLKFIERRYQELHNCLPQNEQYVMSSGCTGGRGYGCTLTQLNS